MRVSDAQICLTQVTMACWTTTEPKIETVAAWEMGDGARTTARLADVMGKLVLRRWRDAQIRGWMIENFLAEKQR